MTRLLPAAALSFLALSAAPALAAEAFAGVPDERVENCYAGQRLARGVRDMLSGALDGTAAGDAKVQKLHDDFAAIAARDHGEEAVLRARIGDARLKALQAEIDAQALPGGGGGAAPDPTDPTIATLLGMIHGGLAESQGKCAVLAAGAPNPAAPAAPKPARFPEGHLDPLTAEEIEVCTKAEIGMTAYADGIEGALAALDGDAALRAKLARDAEDLRRVSGVLGGGFAAEFARRNGADEGAKLGRSVSALAGVMYAVEKDSTLSDISKLNLMFAMPALAQGVECASAATGMSRDDLLGR